MITGRTLQLRREFPADRERVFRAFTDPDLVRRWLQPPGGSMPSAEIDLRVGGSYRFEMRPPLPARGCMTGTYLEIEPPERLVFTVTWEGVPIENGNSTVTVEFRELGNSTEMVLTQVQLPSRLSRAFHNLGWSTSFRSLRKRLEAR